MTLQSDATKSNLDQLTSYLTTLLNRDNIDPDSTLAEIGIDSMNVVELILACEQLYSDFNIEKLQLNAETTLRDIDKHLSNKD